MKLTNEELKIAKRKYNEQQGGCRYRIDKLGNPIEMRLTFDQWIDIWLQSGHWYERGCRKGQYVMSRFNDTGHYEIGNVEIKTIGENTIENIKSDQYQQMRQSSEHQQNVQLAANKRVKDLLWQKNHIKGIEKRDQNLEYQKSRCAGIQKAHNKPISCDGIIYPSRTNAGLILAPSSRSTKDSKIYWIHCQMKKYPERYFYV